MDRMRINRLLKAALPFIILLAVYLALCAVYTKNIDHWINSDTASDLVMSRLLADEKKLISDSWYYSSELHVIKTQLVTVPLFMLTNNWHTVRIVSAYILFAILLLSYLYMCSELRIPAPLWALGALLLLPFSQIYFEFVLMGCYYIPYLSVAFLSVGLLFQSSRENRSPRRILLLSAGCLIALFSGMGGPRQLLMLYLPLCLAGLITAGPLPKIKGFGALPAALKDSARLRFTAGAALFFLCCCIGYAFNMTVLSRIYSFSAWDEMSFQPFTFQSLQNICNGFLTTFGFRARGVFSKALIMNLSCGAICLFALLSAVNGLKNRSEEEAPNRFLAVFFLASLTIFLLLYLFTDVAYEARYNISILVFAFPLSARNLRQLFMGDLLRRAAAAAAAAVVLAACVLNYGVIVRQDKTKYLREISAYLAENGFSGGYATYWNGNVLTELTNGAVEIWVWCDSTRTKKIINLESVDVVYEWLQKKSHSETHPEGKIFLVLSRQEYDLFPWKNRLHSEQKAFSTSDGSYFVYAYQDYAALCAALYGAETP